MANTKQKKTPNSIARKEYEMYRVSVLLVAALAAIGLSFVLAPSALADDYQCIGAVGAVTKDTVVVPDGATCTLTGTIAEGDIKVGTGSTLNANGVKVNGNVQAEGATLVEVYGSSTVGGSIQVKQGGGVYVDQVYVTGDIQFNSNQAAANASRNTVGGNIQVFTNTGGASITDNTIDGNLQCNENVPAPTGARNQAASLEDQCATFGGTPTDTPPIVNPPGGGGNGDDFQCTGAVGALTKENVNVPSGATCTLAGTIVQGNIIVGTGSTLNASGVKVDGNVQAEGSTKVTVKANSTVGGNIQVKQGGGAFVDQVKVTGDIQFESNTAEFNASRNTVGGNIQVFSNSGGASIIDNRIDGNLQCKSNFPAPTGARNQAQSLEDQCAGFGGAPTNTAPVTDIVCSTTYSAQTYNNVTVPNGATCTLNGSVVRGNIKVNTGATLSAFGVQVAGNIQAQGAASVRVEPGTQAASELAVSANSFVGGSVQLVQGNAVTINSMRVTGDILLDSNQGQLAVENASIGGNLQAFQNTNNIVLRSNAIGGNLQCTQNSTAPIGGGNVASSLEDQCAALGMTAGALDLRLHLPSVFLRR